MVWVDTLYLGTWTLREVIKVGGVHLGRVLIYPECHRALIYQSLRFLVSKSIRGMALEP